MRRESYTSLIIFFTSYLLLTSFPRAVLNPHFLSSGLNFNILFLGTLVLFLAQIGAILTFRNLSARFSFRAAIIFFILAILLIIKIESIVQYLIYCAFLGFGLFFFFVFYNIAHFQLTPKEKTGQSSAIMFSITPVISVVVPILAGILASININLVWSITILLSLFSLFLVKFQKDFRIKYEISQAFKEINKTRIFIFLEGIWEAMVFAVIPIYTLFFIKTPISYGAFLSYLGLVSVLANLLLGRLTDKKQKRAIFLYPITIGLAITTFLFIFAAQSLFVWIILTGIITFILPLFWNITTAMFVDNQNNLELSFPGRELVLALGRVVGVGLTFLAFAAKFDILLYIALGFVMLIFSGVLFYRTRISKKFSYL